MRRLIARLAQHAAQGAQAVEDPRANGAHGTAADAGDLLITWIEPEIAAGMSSEDARNSRDAAMEAILKEITSRPAAPLPPENTNHG